MCLYLILFMLVTQENKKEQFVTLMLTEGV